MAEWIKVVLLGIVEGVTEFLPISSTGHLIVTAAFLELSGTLSGTFEIFIQIGAIVAVIAYYRKDLVHQFRSFPSEAEVRRFWFHIIIAFIPAALLGFLFGDLINEILFRPSVVAVALILGGILFLVAERLPHMEPQPHDKLIGVTLRQALIVGIVQTIALIPGMSRSGMSIIGGVFAGMSRQTATHFSFYLAIPTLGGATVYTLVRSLSDISVSDLGNLLLGALVSGIVAWFSIGWLLTYIAEHNFVPFGYYRIAAGIFIIFLLLAGVL